MRRHAAVCSWSGATAMLVAVASHAHWRLSHVHALLRQQELPRGPLRAWLLLTHFGILEERMVEVTGARVSDAHRPYSGNGPVPACMTMVSPGVGRWRLPSTLPSATRRSGPSMGRRAPGPQHRRRDACRIRWMRGAYPMNIVCVRGAPRAGVQADIDRTWAIGTTPASGLTARALALGRFSAADAMYAPGVALHHLQRLLPEWRGSLSRCNARIARDEIVAGGRACRAQLHRGVRFACCRAWRPR